ncbi:hypothetical protein DM02DRAFT_525332 [Periconia macrospinosa]|uniref:CENP-V/GFA domain-containing protein n=1 Tax=Periconia macrospinosa TaxID=97972 RepID=A0A2V1DSJ3_9PLEO|nr:hypothetical protein DM02DRAFT_525332 [Periconia macrospinosa]
MPSGSCFCGAIKLSFTGDPIACGLCHCHDCRKLTSSAFSVSYIVPLANLTLTGATPKEIHKSSDSGNKVTNYFCGECGSPLYGKGAFGENVVVRAGCLDGDELEKAAPQLELYSERRVPWLGTCEGAKSVKGMWKPGQEGEGKEVEEKGK